MCILFVAVTSLVMTGCLPTGNENVNTDLFKNKEDFKQRAAVLKPGLTKKEVFEALGVPQEKFERLGTAGIQATLYGNSQVQGTPEQLEQFRDRIASYEGYTLPYRFIKSDSSLGFGTMKVHKSGEDMRIVLVFNHDRLMRASVEGTEQLSSDQDQYLWGALLSKGIGMAF